jgi:hypothetical protein
VEELRRGSARQEGAGAARLHGGQVMRLETRYGMADAENTTLNGDQEASRHSRPDLRLSQPGCSELVARDHSV